MKRSFRRRNGLRVALTLMAVGTACATVLGTSAFATASTATHASSGCVSKPGISARHGRIAGIVGATATKGCATAGVKNGYAIKNSGDNANGAPPLIWHGGAVMGTKLTGPYVITPIFWNPTTHPMNASYKKLITQYLADVAKESGTDTDVQSIATEYYGTDGQIVYNIKLGTPINDTNPLPKDGCVLQAKDRSGIYANGTGYNACLDDAQVIAEAEAVTTADHLPTNETHVYVVYLPKHVESCFYSGSTVTDNECTINYEPTAAYCAYHSFVPEVGGTNLIYANLPFPIYQSATKYTCGTDVNFPGVVETPNNNPDADTEISPTSHETTEAWTDPDTESGWYDIVGYEIADECAYIFGPTKGTAGHFYNQTINGHHYMLQEEFSNNSYFASGGGCLQHEPDS
jgi:hypothetical protein